MKRIYVIMVLMSLFIITPPYYAIAQTSIEEEEEWFGPTIYLDDFENKASISSDLYGSFKAKIREGFNDCKRVSVIDSDTEKLLKREESRRNSGAAVDANSLFDKMKSLGANYIAKVCLVSNTTKYIVPQQSSDQVGKFLDALGGGSPYWTCTLTWSVDVVNVKTSRVQLSQTFTSEESSYGKDCKESEAIQKAINKIEYTAWAVANALSPLDGEILKVESVNKRKTKAETVIINVGSRKKLAAGDGMYVYVTMDIAGEQATEKIGKLSVEKVLSPNRSLCEVEDGEKEILEYSKKNTKMTIRTY